jgi:hypothetical protein
MFTQEIRWSTGAMWALGALYALVMASMLAPAFFLPPHDPELVLMLTLAFVTAALLVAIACTFTTLRITVDDQVLTVGFGPFRERVPLARIVACSPTTYRWFEWGGWGIRFGWRAKLYNVPGDRGIAVQVTLDDGRRVLFSSPDPAALCRAVRERRPEIGAAEPS